MKAKRIDAMKDLIHQKNMMSIEDLSKHFDVSINTVRRDVNELEKRNVIKKVYGGVKAIKREVFNYDDRNIINKEEKTFIAQNACQYIEKGDILFIDSGTTTSEIVSFLPKEFEYTILTNNLDIINRCSVLSNITLIVLGSRFRHSTRSFVDIDFNSSVADYNIDKAFMAATGISTDNGLSNAHYAEYDIKKWVVGKSNQIFALVDNSKFGYSTLMSYATLDEIDYLITDKKPNEEFVKLSNDYDFHLIYNQ
ncbi:DeoR/GlpR family DNA-binding transcription regulator [Dolosicoccus paucivorans]|uniref:DeoR/GlpR family DNA-binding transcription regulator n=1 Tax=Dolosicoccus paucivorans TaxID=84521 RepID=UPI0015E08211|nr:DeoR/GlpR family DNA-binding transcription regulator [Dolosicoccus paucivorans]